MLFGCYEKVKPFIIAGYIFTRCPKKALAEDMGMVKDYCNAKYLKMNFFNSQNYNEINNKELEAVAIIEEQLYG